jgi:hypothetical protein
LIVQGEEIAKWVCEEAGNGWTPSHVGLGQITNGEPVFGVVYSNYTKTSISIGARCDSPKKVTGEIYFALFDYPFNQLKVKALRAFICSSNHKSISLVTKLGFRKETILEDYFPEGDGIMFIMKPEYCKYLKYGAKYAKVC